MARLIAAAADTDRDSKRSLPNIGFCSQIGIGLLRSVAIEDATSTRSPLSIVYVFFAL